MWAFFYILGVLVSTKRILRCNHLIMTLSVCSSHANNLKRNLPTFATFISWPCTLLWAIQLILYVMNGYTNHTTQHMADLHIMVIYHISKVISRVTIRLHQDLQQSQQVHNRHCIILFRNNCLCVSPFYFHKSEFAFYCTNSDFLKTKWRHTLFFSEWYMGFIFSENSLHSVIDAYRLGPDCTCSIWKQSDKDLLSDCDSNKASMDN